MSFLRSILYFSLYLSHFTEQAIHYKSSYSFAAKIFPVFSKIEGAILAQLNNRLQQDDLKQANKFNLNLNFISFKFQSIGGDKLNEDAVKRVVIKNLSKVRRSK